MKVILLENIRSLGKLGDQVEVAAGYARNYLLPMQKVLLATRQNLERFQQQRVLLEEKAGELLQAAQARAAAFNGAAFSMVVQATQEGKLFGSVKAQEIHDLLASKGYQVTKQEIHVDRPIRETGKFEFTLRLHPEVVLTLPLTLEAEQPK